MARSKGTGQIIPRGKDKWLVRIFKGRDSSGKKLYFNKVISGSKSDAQKYQTAKSREKDVGVFIENTRMSLDEHLNNWLSAIKSRVAEQTYESYETQVRVHIRPRIGRLRLTNVRIHDVQKVYSEMTDQGLSPTTVRYAHAVLAMAMKKAIELDYIIKNPCDFVELPKQVKKETKAMSPREASAFLTQTASDKYGLVFEFALITGMRPEEYLSLFWSDVDFKRGTVTVQRALVWKKGGGYKFGETKTKRSRRSIPLPENVMTKLKHHRRLQLEQRMKLGDAYEKLDLVFATDLGTPLHYRNLTKRHYEKILKEAGLQDEGFVLYSLRHTCATLLLASGENPKVVSERLGHSSVKTTLDTYSHVLPDMQRSASDRLEAMLYR